MSGMNIAGNYLSHVKGVAISKFNRVLRASPCLSCDSETVVKNGFIHNEKQNHRCNDHDRQFVEEPQNKVISDKTKAIDIIGNSGELSNVKGVGLFPAFGDPRRIAGNY